MNWKEIPLPALGIVRSTQKDQPLAPELWPGWAQRKRDYVAGWLTPLDAPLSTSTGMLSTGAAQAYIDMERIGAGSTSPLTYYRYVYCQITDGRVFQAGPFKDLEYERHREERPPWFAGYRSTST